MDIIAEFHEACKCCLKVNCSEAAREGGLGHSNPPSECPNAQKDQSERIGLFVAVLNLMYILFPHRVYLKNIYGFARLRASHGGCKCPPDTCQEPPFESVLQIPIPNQKTQSVRTGFWFGGGGRIRTIEAIRSRFTVCPLWPLGNSPILCSEPVWSR